MSFESGVSGARLVLRVLQKDPSLRQDDKSETVRTKITD